MEVKTFAKSIQFCVSFRDLECLFSSAHIVPNVAMM
jgi:hypothetical protein